MLQKIKERVQRRAKGALRTTVYEWQKPRDPPADHRPCWHDHNVSLVFADGRSCNFMRVTHDET